MSVFTICRSTLAQDGVATFVESQGAAEAGFTREAGVLRRRFYRCEQQPAVVWTNTQWSSQKAHDDAAESIMKVRRDDRVASAYFRPGLYWEIFALPVARLGAEGIAGEGDRGELVVVCEGLVADRAFDGWADRIATRSGRLGNVAGLVRLEVYWNYASRRQFVAFFEWADDGTYAAAREVGDRTIEEVLLVGGPRSELAAYDQYECRHVSFA